VHRLACFCCTAAIVTTLILGISSTCPGAPSCVEKEQPVTELGRRLYDGQILKASAPIQSISQNSVVDDKVRYLRVLLEAKKLPAGHWYITVRDSKFHVVQVLTDQSFQPSPHLWTSRIDGSFARFELDTHADNIPVEINIKEYIAMPQQTAKKYSYYSWQGATPRYRPLYEGPIPNYKMQYGDSVGFIMNSTGSHPQKSWCCSGVMLTDELFLTNWHCGAPDDTYPDTSFWSQESCEDSVIDLSWDDTKVNRGTEWVPDRELLCDRVESQNKKLDFALLRVKSDLGGVIARPAVARRTRIHSGESLSIIHHPSCMPKQISDDCRVLTENYPNWKDPAKKTDFTHNCDTEGGSSGAPIFDNQGLLVGLHHLGFKVVDPNTCKKDREDKAVHIQEILDYLNKTDPSDFARVRQQ
jgi:hypothetical protein